MDVLCLHFIGRIYLFSDLALIQVTTCQTSIHSCYNFEARTACPRKNAYIYYVWVTSLAPMALFIIFASAKPLWLRDLPEYSCGCYYYLLSSNWLVDNWIDFLICDSICIAVTSQSLIFVWLLYWDIVSLIILEINADCYMFSPRMLLWLERWIKLNSISPGTDGLDIHVELCMSSASDRSAVAAAHHCYSTSLSAYNCVFINHWSICWPTLWF